MYVFDLMVIKIFFSEYFYFKLCMLIYLFYFRYFVYDIYTIFSWKVLLSKIHLILIDNCVY